MQTISLEEARDHLVEIIEKLPPGEEIVLTRDDKPAVQIAPLISTAS